VGAQRKHFEDSLDGLGEDGVLEESRRSRVQRSDYLQSSSFNETNMEVTTESYLTHNTYLSSQIFPYRFYYGGCSWEKSLLCMEKYEEC
jgi:hypothetical protein